MPLLMVCSVKASPGVTTTALALAAAASLDRRTSEERLPPVLVECDPAGGDLMRRHPLAAKPSLVDLAAAARNAAAADADPFEVATQGIRLRDRDVNVVVTPAGGAQTRAALPELTRPGSAVLNPPDRLVIADCGRLDQSSPCRPLLGSADVVLVLVRARVDAIAHLREHLADVLEHSHGHLRVVLAPGGRYTVHEISDVLISYVVNELARDTGCLSVLGPLPADRKAAAVLGGELVAGRRWWRLPLLVATGRLLDVIVPRLITPATDTAHILGGTETLR